MSTLCIHNPAGCFGLGFLWNVIPRVCGRRLVIRCGKRGANGFEFGSRDKGNPRVSKCRIISTRILSHLAFTSISGVVAIASIARENAGNFVSRTVPNDRSSFAAGPSFWSYATDQLLSCRWIARNTYCRIIWSRVASAESQNYLTSSEG